MVRLVLSLLFFLLIFQPSFAAPAGLKKASIEEISGDVIVKKESDVADRKAVLKESIIGKDIIRTGKKSRAELEFEDQSICRLGSNTIFSFDPQTRDMAFSRGVALVHVPPGKGGARIATPAATAAIQGDTLVVRATVMPDGTPATQFTALSPRGGPTDGNIMVTLNNNPNATFRLEGGQVAIVPANANSLSQVPRAEIDVGTFTAKSPILQGLPPTAKNEVQIVTVNQSALFNSGAAERTPYAIVGDQVVKADANGNFTPPPPSPIRAGAGNPPPPGGTVMPDGTVVMPNGTKISPDGTITRPDGTTSTATTLADGTQVMPDGTKVSPDGTVVRPDGTTYAGTARGNSTYTAPDGTALSYNSPTYSGSSTMSFFSPDHPLNTAFNPFQETLAQILGKNDLPPPHPPFIVPYDGTYLATISSSATFDTGTGFITGLTLGTHYNFGRDDVLGISQFSFDRLTLNGASISVQGPYDLRLHTVNNSATANPIQITGNNTIAFAAGTPHKVELVTDFGGNITQSSSTDTLSVNGSVNMLAPSGNVTSSGTIDTSGASAGINRNVAITGHSVSTGTITTTGATGGNGGNVDIHSLNATGTITLNNAITTTGGTTTTSVAGDGGNVKISANTITFGGSSSIQASGGAATSTGIAGNGGTVSINTPNALATVSGVTIISNGGAGTSSGVGGDGGIINLAGNSISIPAGSTLSAAGGAGSSLGGDGGVINLKGTGGAVGLTTSTDVSILNAAGGTGSTGGNGGALNFVAPTTSTITVNDSTAITGSAATITAAGGVSSGLNGTITSTGPSITYSGTGVSHTP